MSFLVITKWELFFVLCFASMSLCAETTATPKASSSTFQTKTTKKSVPIKIEESPFSSVVVLNASRAADIHHSKTLIASDPDARNEGSLALIASLAYKVDKQNSISILGAITQDLIRDSTNEEASKPLFKNVRLGFSRSTDLTLLGSDKITFPFSISLPTSPEARKTGFLTSVRFWPIFSWQLSKSFSLAYGSKNDMTLTTSPEAETNFEQLMETATLLTSNAITLSYALTNSVFISQTVGVGTMSKNLRNPLEADQQGASFDIGSGISYLFSQNLMFDFVVNQSSPLQGEGLGVKVYDDNEYKPFHIAQTNFSLTATMIF